MPACNGCRASAVSSMPPHPRASRRAFLRAQGCYREDEEKERGGWRAPRRNLAESEPRHHRRRVLRRACSLYRAAVPRTHAREAYAATHARTHTHIRRDARARTPPPLPLRVTRKERGPEKRTNATQAFAQGKQQPKDSKARRKEERMGEHK